MKTTLKFLTDESVKIQLNLKNKMNLLKLPVNILTEKEIKNMKKIFQEYSIKVDKLVATMTELSTANQSSHRPQVTQESIDDKENREAYEDILKRNKLIRENIEYIIQEYEKSQYQKSEKNFQMKGHYEQMKDDLTSEISESTDNDKPEISKVFVNSIITTNHIIILKSKATLDEEKQYISDIFHLDELFPDSTSKQEMLLDFYLNNYKFCLKEKFSIEKISTFLSIFYFLFSYSLVNNNIMKNKSIELYKELIDFHSINRPPFSYEIFSPEEKGKLINFAHMTFFRNYSLLESIFKYSLNINFYSKDFKRIPNKPLPKVGDYELKSEYLVTADNTPEIIKKLYIEKTIAKKKEIKEEVKIEKKTDEELYDEAQMKELKNFISSFYKSNTQIEQQRALDEQKRLAGITEKEGMEVKDYLDVKIPEYIKETHELISLANKEVLGPVNSALSEYVESKTKKK